MVMLISLHGGRIRLGPWGGHRLEETYIELKAGDALLMLGKQAFAYTQSSPQGGTE
jgi:alkylated DNA repair dioxygenase AlkB